MSAMWMLPPSASTRDPAHLHSLFRDKVERINPGFGFDLITLAAGDVEPMRTVQKRLDGSADDDLHLTLLVDRLTAKFGTRAVSRPILRESHVPERAEGRVAALANPMQATTAMTKRTPHSSAGPSRRNTCALCRSRRPSCTIYLAQANPSRDPLYRAGTDRT